MVFNSFVFFVFFACVAVVHHTGARWTTKKITLLVANCLFYGAWNPPLLVLLWASILLDYVAARAMERAKTRRTRKAFLVVSLCGNLGMLVFFKYGGFLVANFSAALTAVGVSWDPPAWDIVLPVGISFYTFQSLSYTIDVYRGQMTATSSLLDYALYVSFFPQLVAGPIVRGIDFLPQVVDEKRGSSAQWSSGLTLLVVGLFQKLVLADGILAVLADHAYLPDGTHSFADAWIGTLAFSGQIFFDFAGYTLCAIGVARCLGFELTDNFRSPYGASGFSDFWRRWHVSLSSWLRDYLYIPLGGNRGGRRRTELNLMATMLIGGLWHGASWTFVVWGGLHGLFLVAERWLRGPQPSELQGLGLAAGIVLTYVLVCFTWVFFRAPDFSTAWEICRAMIGFGTAAPGHISSGVRAAVGMLVIVGLLFAHVAGRRTHIEQVLAAIPPWQRGALIGVMLLAIVVLGGGQRAFIYFQF